MNRNYNGQVLNNASFFIGNEIEHTPAYGKKTLFVVGMQNIEEIKVRIKLNDIEHIFFGANHSFNPQTTYEIHEWDYMIEPFLINNYIVSLDIPINKIDLFMASKISQYTNFIPQIRVPIPFINKWNPNTMIKIDDYTFNFSNPGIWTHQLKNLMTDDVFTSWEEYNEDKAI